MFSHTAVRQARREERLRLSIPRVNEQELMKTILSMLLMMPVLALAAAQEEAVQAPSEPVSMVYVVLFGVVFVAMIAGFFIYLWWNEKHKTPE